MVMYLYIFKQYTYGVRDNCKVGVSKNPEKRRFYYGCSGFDFHKKWLMPDRASAFAFEALVCRSFPRLYGRELLAATAEEVSEFIEINLTKYVGQK